MTVVTPKINCSGNMIDVFHGEPVPLLGICTCEMIDTLDDQDSMHAMTRFIGYEYTSSLKL